MPTRLSNENNTNNNKPNNLSDNNSKDEFGVTEVEQPHISSYSKTIIKNQEKKDIKLDSYNKKLDDDEDNDDDSGDGDSDDNKNDDDSPNFRDKDKELKDFIKSGLSADSQDVINMNEDEFNEIIEKLKKRGVSQDKGMELQKIKNILRSRGSIAK